MAVLKIGGSLVLNPQQLRKLKLAEYRPMAAVSIAISWADPSSTTKHCYQRYIVYIDKLCLYILDTFDAQQHPWHLLQLLQVCDV